MWRFILTTFAFLGWAFFELSGGSDYEPRSRAPMPDQRAEAARSDDNTAITRGQSDLTALPDAKVTLAAATAKAVRAADQVGVAALGVPTVKAAPQTANTQTVQIQTTKATPVSFTAPSADEPALDLRQISGNRVNLRLGPGTEFNKIGQLLRGTDVEILQDPGNGWVKLRVMETKRIGWMADYLVTASN